ncbi:MAG: RHS repeat-associated core domain-containing protein [Owenweeksia sp.]
MPKVVTSGGTPDGYDGNGTMNLNTLIPNWDPAWSYALISKHPEYDYKISVCTNQELNPSGNPLKGEEYDWMLSTINTFSEAGSAQYLGQPTSGINLVASFSGTNFPIMLNDPFYILSTTSEQTAFRNSLNNYKGQGKNIYAYAAQMAQCGNWFGANHASCSYSAFGTSSDVNVRNQEWQLLQGFYLAAKQEFIYNKATVAALNIGGIISNPANKGYFNGAIGHDKFNYFRYLIERYNINLSATWSFTTFYTLYYTYLKQVVSGPPYKLYEKKQKRVAFYDPYLATKETETSENDADYEIYKKTGICPLGNDLKLFLEDLMVTNRIKPATPQIEMLQVDGFTRDMYLAVTGFNNISGQNYARYKWAAVQNNSRKITGSLNIISPVTGSNNVTANTVSNFLFVEFDSQSSFNWNDYHSGTASNFEITKVRRLIPNGNNTGGLYGFSVEVDIEKNGVEYVEVLTGQVKLNIAACQGIFSGIAHRSQMADDLEHLFNILASEGDFTAIGVNIEQTTPPYSYPFKSSIEPVLDPYNNIGDVFKWYKVSSTKYEIRSNGTGRFIRIEFCGAPGFSNGFDDVTFFENLKPMSLLITNSCIVDGRMANFNVDVVQVDQSTGSVVGQQTLAGHMGIFSEDGTVYEGPLNLGYYGSLTAREDDCTQYNEARTAFSTFMGQVMPADYSDHVYPSYGIFGYTHSPLPEVLRNMLGTGVVFDSCPVSTDIAYMGLRVPQDPGYYVGMFWSHHGTPTTLPSYSINFDEQNGGYDLTLDGCGHAYGYFDCPIKMEFLDQTQGYDFANVDGISHLEVNRDALDSNGFTDQFIAIAHMNDGSLVKIKGSSCFTFSNCSNCTPVLPEVPTNCWADYADYQTLVAAISDLEGLEEGDFCELNFSSCFKEYESYIHVMGVTEVGSPYYISLEDFCRNDLAFYLDYYFSYLMGFLGVNETSEIASHLPGEGPSFDNQLIGLMAFANAETGLVCVVDYLIAKADGWNEGTILDYCEDYLGEYPCPILNFKPFPETEWDQNPCVEYYTNVAQSNAQQAYDLYINQVKDDFKRRYIDHAMTLAVETFNRYSRGSADYHYTLYYYDQAGNLVRTVPPKGVQPFSLSGLSAVKANRDLAYPGGIHRPGHTLSTKYVYNSLNQLVSQTTPDGGTSDFWYDDLGRLVLSRNAQQNVVSGGKRRYSYSLYDELGRIYETGQLESAFSNPVPYLNASNFPDNLATTRQEVTRTYYDQVELPAAQTYYQGQQAGFIFENLQNRVSAIASYKSYNASGSNPHLTYDAATHYSYDEHGNVKTLVQDKRGHFTADALRFKRIDYTYDLISGNVKEVGYQVGDFDQLYHRYTYDADNRITQVTTSKDGVIWDTDASYDYYHHGPLARTELGEFKVQGLDLAYTLNGWLKTLNSSTLKVDRDMRKDDNSPTYDVARDAYAYSLHYFNGDYEPIGTNGIGGTNDAIASISGMSSYDLHNGNIGAIVNSIWNTSEDPIRTHGSRYRYDQLNRLREMDVFHKYNSGTDGVIGDNNFNQATLTTDYKVRLNYDANGNITGLERNGYAGAGNVAMDNLTYTYYSATNRLQRVDDAVSAGNYTTDVDDQTIANNYTYDAIGNMVSDAAEEIATISWTVSGKVKSITRTTGSTKPNLDFEYDASGNRITKIEKPRPGGVLSSQGQWTYTHYVRDASGNVMGIYEESFASCQECIEGATHDFSLKVSDQPVYGSERVGNIRDDRERTGQVSFSGGNITYHGLGDIGGDGAYRERELGNKDYELKNHLGNVQVTVADYKIWKTTEIEGSIFDHPFDSEDDVYEWREEEIASFQFQEGQLYVSYGESESGMIQTVEGISSACSYQYCITITELEPQPIVVHITDQHGQTIIYEEIWEPGEYCWEISELGEAELFNIAVLSVEREGYFIVDHTSLTYSCPNAILIADVLTSQDYYPFGMMQPGRNYNSGNYRYGFSGEEKDNETKGDNNSYDFGARIYDPRYGKWLSVDPLQKKYPDLTPYAFVGNTPIQAKEIGGKDFVIIGNEEYRARVTQLLRDLYNQSPTARKAIMDIASSDKVFLIVENEERATSGNYYQDFNSSKSDGFMIFSFEKASQNLDVTNGRNGEELAQNPLTNFSHELGHMYDDFLGVNNLFPNIYDRSRTVDIDGNTMYPSLDADEVSGVKFENKVRGELGLDFRTHYYGFYVFNKKAVDITKEYSESMLVDDNYDYSQHNTDAAVTSNLNEVFNAGNWWDVVFTISNAVRGHTRFGYGSENVPNAESSSEEYTRITIEE